MNDILDGLVSFVVGGLKFAVGPEIGIWLVMEAGIGERTAEPLVKEEEEERNLHALWW